MRGSAAFRASVTPGGALAGPWVRNSLWTAARAVPSLDLRFADNKSLVDATTGRNLVTFTRASSGTYVDSQGVIRTATTNLLLRSEEFDNASWGKTTATVTANAAIAPNGTLTADKLITDSGASGGRVNVGISLVIGSPTTLSCFAKQGETSLFGLFISDGVTGRAVDFDLATGTISGTPTAGMTASIQPAGDGWYRCVATVTSSAGASGSIRIRQAVSLNDGTSGLFIWGAQLEQSATVGEYIPTTSTINSAPRFDHNPTTGESLGLLVEEQRTNLLLYSEDLSVTASWTISSATLTPNNATAPDGTLTADTVTAIGTALVFQSTTKTATAITYTGSVFVKGTISGGFSLTIDDGATVNRGRVIFNLSTGTVTSATNDGTFTGTLGTITSFPNDWYRLTITTTTNSTTVARLRPFWTGAGTSIDFWGAQLEAASFPTSYIPTTTAAATRSADVASITGSNFSSWYRQDQGSLFVSASASQPSTGNRRIAFATDGTSNNRVGILFNSTNNPQFLLSASGTPTASISSSVTATGFVQSAAGYALDDFAFAASGSLAGTDTLGAVPSTVDRLSIGSQDNVDRINGTIRRLTYWPTRLANETLQRITQ